MGRVRLEDPKSAALLPTWKQQPGMHGVRVTFNTPPTLAWLSDAPPIGRPASREGWLAVMFLAVGEVQVRQHRGAPPAAHAHHRPHGLNSSSRATGRVRDDPGGDCLGHCARQISERQRQVVGCGRNSLEPYPFRDNDSLREALVRCLRSQRCHWGTDITNSLVKASYRQRVAHFTKS